MNEVGGVNVGNISSIYPKWVAWEFRVKGVGEVNEPIT
jgi:hypothetical protein